MLVNTPGYVPTAFNFAPEPPSTWSVAAVAECAFAQWGTGSWRPDEVEHGSESVALALDSQLARDTLGWRARLDTAEAIEWTVEWWRRADDFASLYSLAIEQLDAYEGREA
jgi:CDP-glucose 4,6-dehydratase